MFVAATIAVIISILLGLIRAFLGPTIYDRVLAGNMIGTLTVILISVHGFLTERPEFLDIALVYALINFIGTIAILKYFRFKDLGHAGTDHSANEQENM
ncbi:MAG: cation:proton antiporter [Methylocystaceae bacterium]|nr:cation:proton antiporter [Methylocystaceae bacterium]